MAANVSYSVQERYKQLLEEIEAWLDHELAENSEQSMIFIIENQKERVNRSFSQLLDQLSESQKRTVLEILEQLIAQLTGFLFEENRCAEVEQKLMIEARQFNPNLKSVVDLFQVPFYQLEYLEEKFKSKYQVYALIQGGISGWGHSLSLAMDLPALMIIQLGLIQHIAGTYGYSLRSIKEQRVALYVLYASTLPASYRQYSWRMVVEQIKAQDEYAFLGGNAGSMLQEEWLETVAKQLLKSFLLLALRRGSKKGFSLFGVFLGANMNYFFTKEMAKFSSFLYRYRFLTEHMVLE